MSEGVTTMSFSLSCDNCGVLIPELIWYKPLGFKGINPKVCPGCGRRFEAIRTRDAMKLCKEMEKFGCEGGLY